MDSLRREHEDAISSQQNQHGEQIAVYAAQEEETARDHTAKLEQLEAGWIERHRLALETLRQEHEDALSSHQNEHSEQMALRVATAVDAATERHDKAVSALRNEHVSMSAAAAHSHEQELRKLAKEASDEVVKQRNEHASLSAAAARQHEEELRQLTKEATDEMMKLRTVRDSQVRMNSSRVRHNNYFQNKAKK